MFDSVPVNGRTKEQKSLRSLRELPIEGASLAQNCIELEKPESLSWTPSITTMNRKLTDALSDDAILSELYTCHTYLITCRNIVAPKPVGLIRGKIGCIFNVCRTEERGRQLLVIGKLYGRSLPEEATWINVTLVDADYQGTAATTVADLQANQGQFSLDLPKHFPDGK